LKTLTTNSSPKQNTNQQNNNNQTFPAFKPHSLNTFQIGPQTENKPEQTVFVEGETIKRAKNPIKRLSLLVSNTNTQENSRAPLTARFALAICETNRTTASPKVPAENTLVREL